MAIQIDYNDPRYAQAAAEILRRHDNGGPEANITSAVRDFLILTGLASGEENPPAQGSRRAVDLTALDTFIEFKLNGEDVSGRGVFTVELERFDPRTGAALLTIEAEDLAVAPRYRGRVAHGEPHPGYREHVRDFLECCTGQDAFPSTRHPGGRGL